MLPNIHSFFFFNDTATTEIYTLSLHDALPISPEHCLPHIQFLFIGSRLCSTLLSDRSEEHTSELQSRLHLVCRLLLEKKKRNVKTPLVNRCIHFVSGRTLLDDTAS